MRVATKENKNEKRQFKNTAERHKKQHRLATNKTVLTYMNSKIYRTILLYRRKNFCATVLNAPNDLESQKEVLKVAESRRRGSIGAKAG